MSDQQNNDQNKIVNDPNGFYLPGAVLLDVYHHNQPEMHKFGEAFHLPVTPLAVATTAFEGTSDTPAREDHVHGPGPTIMGTSGLMSNAPGGSLAYPIGMLPSNFGATNGTRWLFQLWFGVNPACTAGVQFTITLNTTFPSSEQQAWAWPSVSASSGQFVTCSTIFPGGNHAQVGLTSTVTLGAGSVFIGLLVAAQYPA